MSEVTEPRPSPSPLDFVAVVAAVTGAALLAAGAVAAFALADIRGADGTERFRLLAQSASPSVAAFALVGVAIAVHGRRRAEGWAASQRAPGAALGIGAAAALVGGLLALNGVVVDLTQEGAPGLYRLGNVIGRLATLALCALALWAAATAPARPGTRPAAAPPPSPPGAPDPSSPV